MAEITRNVTEIEPADRRALERVLGQPLHDHQKVVVRLVSPGLPEDNQRNGNEAGDDDTLPEWCNVSEGLSDDEIAAIEEIILTRGNLTRGAE